jgi:H+/Cl- antiporter ClcA
MPTALSDPAAMLRSRPYLMLLVLAAILGIPISAVAYGFLDLISHIQTWIFDPTQLPQWLGFDGVPDWWPLLPLGVAGLLVGLAIRYLPGTAGHSPADGLHAGGAPTPIELPGVVLAALASLALGAVVGPEAPLIAIGSGLAACAIRLSKRDTPPTVTSVLAATGAFAAISALLGSPILGAFLLMEAIGLGGATLGLVLLPGLLASGVGYLIFIGLDSWTGHGTFSLAVPDLPPVGNPNGTEFLWALAIGVAAALLGTLIRLLALQLRVHVRLRRVTVTALLGLAIAGLAILYAQSTGHETSDVLFSGENALGSLLTGAAGFSVGTLMMLVLCKGLAYGASLSGFRGGPTFPGMYIGAAGGIALSHLAGLRTIPGAAMGIGAMCVVMLGLPLTSVLLATLFLGTDGVPVMPLVIVAVVVAHVTAAKLAPILIPTPPVSAAVGSPPEPATPSATE